MPDALWIETCIVRADSQDFRRDVHVLAVIALVCRSSWLSVAARCLQWPVVREKVAVMGLERGEEGRPGERDDVPAARIRQQQSCHASAIEYRLLMLITSFAMVRHFCIGLSP